jgi:hypothetical protein
MQKIHKLINFDEILSVFSYNPEENTTRFSYVLRFQITRTTVNTCSDAVLPIAQDTTVCLLPCTKNNRPDYELSHRLGVIRVDRDCDCSRTVRVFTEDFRIVLGDIAAFHNPPTEIFRSGSHHHKCDRTILLALRDRSHRRRRVPDITNNARPEQ